MRQALRRIGMGLAALALVAIAAGGTLKFHYFDAKDLDPHPYPLRGIVLEPPKERDGIEHYGKLVLDIYIDAQGKVDHIDARQSMLPATLQEEALREFSGVRWEPGRLWGMPVRSVKRVEIDLEPPPGVNAPAPTR